MCERASFLAVYPDEVYYLPQSDSHEDMREARGVNESQAVSIECLPRGDPFSLNPNDWDVIEDDIDFVDLPQWYNHDEWADRIKDVLVKKRIPQELATGKIGSLTVQENDIYDFDWLITIDNLSLRSNAKASFQSLQELGHTQLYPYSQMTAPNLEKIVHNCYVTKGATLSTPKCTYIDYLTLGVDTEVTLPAVHRIDCLDAASSSRLIAVACQQIRINRMKKENCITAATERKNSLSE